MSEITAITLVMSLDEARAVHIALGKMTSAVYGSVRLADAGGDVYAELTPIVEEDE